MDMVSTYIVPADFDVRNAGDGSGEVVRIEMHSTPAGDEVAAAQVAEVVGSGASGYMDEWADLIGGSETAAVNAKAAVNVVEQSPAIETSFPPFEVEVVEAVEAQPEEENQEQPPTEDEQPIEQTNEQRLDQSAETKRDRVCRMISKVKTSIRSIDSTIADLSSELRELKKTRGNKLERLLELAEELEVADDSPAGDEADDESEDEQFGEGEGADDSITDDSSDSDNSTATADYFNPWDKWEQGDSINVVRVLVDTQGIEAGSALETFDVEPPQETGDSLTGNVVAFRLNSRETVTLSKRECCPMVHWIEHAPVGQLIGERPKVTKTSANVKAKTTVPDDSDESWRAIPISELQLSKSIENLLIEENGIKTIGDLSNWTSRKRLTDLSKIGQAKADKIQEADEEFWARWNAGKVKPPTA